MNLPSGQQLFIADLPEGAVREAVVNGYMHREYRVSEAVQVEHSSTRLAMASPGDFMPGISADNLLIVSPRSRNPALAAAMRRLGLAEDAGVGIDRMYAEMARVGHGPPSFTSDRHRVTVTLLGGAPNTAVTRFVSSLPTEWRANPDPLMVMLALLGQRTVTAARLATVLQKAEDEVGSHPAAPERAQWVHRTDASLGHPSGRRVQAARGCRRSARNGRHVSAARR